MTVAELPHSLQVARRRHIDAAFTLDRFQQNGAGCRSNRAAQGFDVAERDVAEARQRRRETVPDLLLAGRADGADGPAVKGGEGGDHLEAVFAVLFAAVFACQLDGGFIGFGARIAEKDPVGEGMLAKPFRQFDLLGDLVEIGTVQQAPGLFPECGDHLGMAVSEVVDGNAGEKVQETAALDIPQAAALAADRHQRIAAIGFHHGEFGAVDPVL